MRSLAAVVLVVAGCAATSRPPAVAQLHAFPAPHDGTTCPLGKTPATDDEMRTVTLGELRRLKAIRAVASGPMALVDRWRQDGAGLIIPAAYVGLADPGAVTNVDELRQMIKSGRVAVIGEAGFQYEGAAPDDPRVEPFLALAEELDVPIAIHMGLGPPGVGAIKELEYTVAAGDPLRLEQVLKKHPKLRIDVMHAAWPMADAMIAILYAYPNVYVDTGVIDFGSDQMTCPAAIERALGAIESADFLTAQQRRAILHDNAVRFLRLEGI